MMYTNWKLGDNVQIGAKVEDFCGTQYQYIWLDSHDMELYPTPLNITCLRQNCSYSCIDTRNREVIFYSCMNYISTTNDINCGNRNVGKFYRELSRVSSDANGISSLSYIVTSQDLADYNDAIASGGNYNIVACINDSLATRAHAINYGNVTITDPCASIVCDPNYICVGCNAYDAICDPNNPTGPCIQGNRNTSKDPNCAFGNLSITSTPQGASIFIDGVAYGQTGTTPKLIPVSSGATHAIKLSLIGYNDYDATASLNCQQTISINPTLTQVSGTPTYELVLKVDPSINPTYITGILDKISSLFIDTLLTYISGIVVITPITYDSTNNEIIIDMQQQSPVVAYMIPGIRTTSPYLISTSDIINIIITVITIFQPLTIFMLGFRIYNWLFGIKTTSPAYTSVTMIVVVDQGGFPTIPSREATVIFNGQTKTTTVLNNTVVFDNVKTNNQYDVDAYIPVSADSNARYAAIKKGFKIQVSTDPIAVTLHLDINTTIQRDYQICNIPKVDGSPAPNGTKIRLYAPQDVIVSTSAGNTVVTEAIELGVLTIQSTGCPTSCTIYANTNYAKTPIFNCTNSIKIEGYIPDSKILSSIIPASVDPNQPDPILQSYLKIVYKTFNDTKNTITVLVNTTARDILVPDTINIKNKDGTVFKTITPDTYVTAIDGIPKGDYTVEAIKSGYKLSSCTPSCDVSFAQDILGAVSVYVTLQSLVTTCQAQVYVLDNSGKHLQTTASVSVDGSKTTYQVLPSDGYTMITGITVGDHKFTVNADGYETVTNFSYTVACKTETEVISIAMKLSGGGPNLQTALNMTVNGSSGSVKVEKNKNFNVNIIGGNPSDTVSVYDTSTTPDTLLAQGITDGTGAYSTTLQLSTDTTVPLQAFQGCVGKCPGALCICSTASNIVTVVSGAGAKECAIPNPLGGCLLYKSTAINIGLIAGAGLIGIVALAAILLRTPAGPTIREYAPSPTGQPIIIREQAPPSVLGATIGAITKAGVE